MQAWALQQVLKRMGHEPVTIDRAPEPKSAVYRTGRLGYRALRKALGRRKAPINFERHMPTILQHTRAFMGLNIAMSEKLDTTEKLKKHFFNNDYDAVIVGSDQTWRPMYSPNIYNFFLDFLEGKDLKRLSYAASFGVDYWEFSDTEQSKASDLLSTFYAISVREESGVDLCRKYLNVNASHVLDPTLLLDPEDYKALIGISGRSDQEKWICTYFLDQSPYKSDFAMKVSEKLGFPLYHNQATCSVYEQTSGNIDDYVMPEVESWIKGFLNAKIVLTDSFHGVVFAILFNKKFIAFKNEGRGKARFDSLAKQLSLPSSSFVNPQETGFDLSLFDGFGTGVESNTLLNQLRANSVNFLKKGIGEV